MSAPVRLSKKTENTVMERIDAWAMAHANILLPLGIIVGIILFVELCYVVCGLAAVESGMMRNFLGGI